MFLLTSHNVFEYLIQHNFCSLSEVNSSQIEPLSAKNFNLLVTFPDRRKFLVKQEKHNLEGKTAGEFLSEYRIQQWLQKFPESKNFSCFLPELLHFDADNSIIIFNYLNDYRDLMDFYLKESSFPLEIADAVGTVLGTIHRDTFNQENQREFFDSQEGVNGAEQVPKLIQSLEKITPDIFATTPADGLKFFALYQRYESLGKAIAQLGNSFTPTCLTHNDLKLNNILLHTNWQEPKNSIIRLIDWERSSWGDPAFDLGTLFGSYISIWLGSLVMSKSLSIEESLNLAVTPLELLQPSIAALTKAYFLTFPEILQHSPDFLAKVVQFAGFDLIQQIQAMIQYQKSFGNTGIAMLQVAKSLLCRPERAMPTLFGKAVIEIVQFCTAA